MFSSLMTRRSLYCRMYAVSLAVLFLATAAPAGDWNYVTPAAGDVHEHPPLRAITLQNERPDDLKEQVTYRGSQRRYAQIRYGSPGSIRVAVVLDQVSPNEADLYVDLNRNRTIEENERIEASERTWRLPIDVAIIEGDRARLEPRSLIFRLGATGRTLSFAAAGYLEGSLVLGDRAVPVRRQDGDGNGFFTDAQDRLWLNLNGDDKWDPVNEQYLFATILTIHGTRYAVRSDEAGSRLAIEKLEGTGTIKVAPATPTSEATVVSTATASDRNEPSRAKIIDLTATLVGRDGSAVGLRGSAAEVTVPIGEYRLSTLTLSVSGRDGELPWSFIFSDNGGRPEHRWYHVTKDATVTLDPIGKLELWPGIADTVTTCRAGEPLNVQPRLYSVGGLLINNCYRGSTQPAGYGGPAARIVLAGTDGAPLAQTQSGFA